MAIGPFQLLIVLVLVLVLFGAGKLPQVFEELGKGMKALRDSQNDLDGDPPVTKKKADDEVKS
ncbi:MAG: twin-arginine translocase TatA/TatE family subunit [Alphaproteobacteria bacterium]|nr:twin-arginine translocase TatA/TatE family subunit [Alphaproteobacteria bacterium]